MHRNEHADGASDEAVEALQQFGLRECEAKCLVALSALQSATADRLSDAAGVPQTRVYEAVRVLEARGLVEIQRSTPQRFRAVAPDEVTAILRDQHDARFERLTESLATVASDGRGGIGRSIRTTDDPATVGNRLIEDADEEVILVLGDERLFTDDLAAALQAAADGATVVVGGATESICEEVRAAVPAASTHPSRLSWLWPDSPSEGIEVGRLLLVDHSTAVLGTVSGDRTTERGVVGDGSRDGVVVFVRRLLSSERRPVPQ